MSSLLLSKKHKIRIYRTRIFPMVLYGYETWSLKLREEHRLRVFEDAMLMRIFGVMGGWSKLYNEKLRNLYTSPSIIRLIKQRTMRWLGHVVLMRRGTRVGCWWESQSEREK
jgi:hypothetical protein